MNGATALDCEKTINSPNSTNTMTIGTSQYFFSCLRNWKNSPSTRLLLMMDLTPAAQTERKSDRIDGDCSADRNQLNRKAPCIRGSANEKASGERADTEHREAKRQTTDNRDG